MARDFSRTRRRSSARPWRSRTRSSAICSAARTATAAGGAVGDDGVVRLLAGGEVDGARGDRGGGGVALKRLHRAGGAVAELAAAVAAPALHRAGGERAGRLVVGGHLLHVH